MFSFDSALTLQRRGRGRSLRLETLEERTVPVLGIGANVTTGGSISVPAAGNSGAIGPNHYVEMFLGGFVVYDKLGNLVQSKTDDLFWQNAGISSSLTITGLAMPRVVYDQLSDRWFAMEINLASTNNEMFLARSDTADPSGTWTAVHYTGKAAQFASFPTLSVDANGVYVGSANFSSRDTPIPTGVTLMSIPKADLLAATPTLANATRFDQGTAGTNMGWAPQVVTNYAAGATQAQIIATHQTVFGKINYTPINGAGGAGATLGSTLNLNIQNNPLPGNDRQPDNTRQISGGDDDRYAGAIYQVGDLIYAVHPISVNASGVPTTSGANTTNAFQLIVIRDSTNSVVAQGIYWNANYDYSYPSVAANQYGDIVIGVNRSGFSNVDGFLGAYAVYARIDASNPTSITFGQEIPLQAGQASYHQQGVATEAWGPNSAIAVDPSNPFAFWTTQEYAQSFAGWATQISQVYVSPRITNVTSTTANGTYGVGANIAITITFNHEVVVTGTPQLALNSGGTALYTSGSGTNTLTFTYTVGAGQSTTDLDYSSITALTLNGGTIKEKDGFVAAELDLPTPGAAGSLGANKDIVITSNVAGVTGVSSTTANGTYGVGANIAITVTFNRAVVVTGAPQLALNSGGTATYASGSGTTTLTFNYTVAAGQNSADLDYTSTSALTLNGGTIKDQATSSDAVLTLPAPGAAGSLGANKNLVIDTVAASVSSVSSTTANGTYGIGAIISITVTFSKPVNVTGTPQLGLNSGGTAQYSSGSGTATLTFTYSVAAGQSSADLDYTSVSALTGGTITTVSNGQSANVALPAPGAAGSLGANKDIVIDTVPAAVSGVSSTTPDGTYGTGANISITVTFTKAVNVTGTPQLALNSGGVASYSSGSGTATLTFMYTVAAGQTSPDLDYTSASALSLSGGTIVTASNSQNATLTLPAPGTAGSLGANKNIVIDAVQATVNNVTSPTPNGTYIFGAVIDITVKFNRVVNVTGTPLLALNSGGTASYLSGSGTDTLTFRYTVGSGESALDLDYASASALSLNGGTIKDSSGSDASLTLPAPGSPGSLGSNKNLIVDAVGPTITQFRVLFGSKWYNVMGSPRFDLPWQIKGIRVVFSEPIYAANVHSIGGLTATSFTGLRTRILTWYFPAISKGSFNATLADTGLNAIKDIAGNPIAAFGQAFKVLYGDFDGNGVVDAADEAGIRAFIASPYQLSPAGYNIFADLSGDGIVNLIDVGIARTRKGQTLP